MFPKLSKFNDGQSTHCPESMEQSPISLTDKLSSLSLFYLHLISNFRLCKLIINKWYHLFNINLHFRLGWGLFCWLTLVKFGWYFCRWCMFWHSFLFVCFVFDFVLVVDMKWWLLIYGECNISWLLIVFVIVLIEFDFELLNMCKYYVKIKQINS